MIGSDSGSGSGYESGLVPYPVNLPQTGNYKVMELL